MIILGIDPGSLKTGYALIKKDNRRYSYIDSGVWRFDREKSFVDRLGLIYEKTFDYVARARPDQIALESLIYVKSVTSLAKLSQARGAMIAACMKTHKGKVFEYSPNLIKSTVAGHGHAGKEGVHKAVQMIFGRSLEVATHDESDALAIALCHGLSMKREMRDRTV